MKLFASLLVALVLASSVLAQGRSRHPVQDLDRAFVESFRRGDANAVAALYAPDATVFTPSAVLRGREAIRADMAQIFNAMNVTVFTIDEHHATTSGRMSTSWGTFTMELTPKAGGTPMRASGRFTGVARKIDGRWQYVMDHVSLPIPAPGG